MIGNIIIARIVHTYHNRTIGEVPVQDFEKQKYISILEFHFKQTLFCKLPLEPPNTILYAL